MILVVDERLVGRHLLAALQSHIRELRRDGVPVPSALTELAAICATRGQARPTFDTAARTGDAADVDQLAVDYRGAADRLDVSDRTVRRLVADGALPAVRVGGSRRIRVRDLEHYLDALPAAEAPASPEQEER